MTDDNGDDEPDLSGAEELRTRRGRSRSRMDRGRSDDSDNPDDTAESTNSTEAGDSDESSASSGSDEADVLDNSDNPSESNNSSQSGGVRDKTHIPIYLDDEHLSEFKAFRSRMQSEFIRTHGEELEFNADLYPAMIRAIAENPDAVRAELDIPTEGDE